MKLHHGFSLLTVKAVDEQARVITGIASTPSPDRMGDIVEPMGAKFKTPMPLLLYHDSEMPVGLVEFAKPTKDGIPFRAVLPNVTEPGTIQDRVNEAYHSLKYKLIAAVSIGFRVLDDGAEMMKNGGIRFTSWEWMELSLVAIPAQPEAIIQSFKSMDSGRIRSALHVQSEPGEEDARAELIKSMDRQVLRAASGATERPTVRLLPPAGVSATPITETQTQGKTMTIKERITATEATRQAKAARLQDIMLEAGKEGRTTDQAEAEEADTLTVEIKSLDNDLVRLRTVESLNLETATVVKATTSTEGTAARGGFATVRTPVKSEPGMDFARMAICLFKAKGDVDKAARFAKQYYGQLDNLNLAFKGMVESGGGVDEFVKGLDPAIRKAAVPAATTTDATYGGPLVAYNQISSDFIEFLRPQTIIGRFGTNGIPSLRRIPFNSHIRGQTSGGTANWVGQGKAKPVTRFDFNDTYLGWTKLAAIAVMTQELARFSDPAAEGLMRQSLTDVIVQRMDIDFIDPTNAGITNVKPKSITNGVTPVASSGGTAANIRTDIAALWLSSENANLPMDSAVYIMDAKTALRLSLQQTTLGTQQFPAMTMKGGMLDGIPVIVSNNLPMPTAGSYVVLVFASEVYLADDGQVTVDVSTEASIEMSDAPTGASDTPTAASLVSMWQTNSMALRAERFVNWAKRRTTAVSILSGVNYNA